MKKALIVGGGFAGCAAAHQLSLINQGWDITLVEAAPFLGGGNKTRWHGGHPFTYGPRHFLTTWEHVYEFLSTYVPMRRCAEHEFVTYVEKDQQFYNFPINRDDIPRMPDRDTIHSGSQPSRARSAFVTTVSGTEPPVPTTRKPVALPNRDRRGEVRISDIATAFPVQFRDAAARRT